MASSGGVDFDFSGLDSLIADLGVAGPKVTHNARIALEVTASNIKKDWRKFSKEENIDGSLRAYPSSIDYDLILDADGSIGAEIGPNLGKNQGSFGFVEEARGGVASHPRHNGLTAAKLNEKDFARGVLKATEGVL